MQVTHEQIHRELGGIEARLGTLEKNQLAMAADVKAMRSQIDQAKGGKWAIFGLFGMAATLGGLVTHILGWVKG